MWMLYKFAVKSTASVTLNRMNNCHLEIVVAMKSFENRNDLSIRQEKQNSGGNDNKSVRLLF